MRSPGLAAAIVLALVAAAGTARAVPDEPVPQVQIEARIVESNRDFARELGVRFRGFEEAEAHQAPAPTGEPFIVTQPSFAPFVLADEDEVLNAPKLVTKDGEAATIEVGDSAATTLRLTPRVLADQTLRIEVDLDPSRSATTMPMTGLQPVRTTVTLRDGGSFAIGGLRGETTGRSEGRGLSKIPLLGRLFRSKERQTEKTQLIIFITPQLLDEEGRSHHPSWSSPPGRPDGVSRERIYRPRPQPDNW